MNEQLQEHWEYKNVVFGRENTNIMTKDGQRLAGQVPHYILVPNITRLTRGRQIEIGRRLWEFTGRSMDIWNSATEDEKFRWGRMRMGKYSYVEIFEEGDEWWYRADSGVGGNYPKSSLLIVKDEL